MEDEKMNEEVELVVRIKNISEDSADITIVKDMQIDLSPEQAQSLKMISTLEKQSKDNSQTESNADENCCKMDVESDDATNGESVTESQPEEEEQSEDMNNESSFPKEDENNDINE